MDRDKWPWNGKALVTNSFCGDDHKCIGCGVAVGYPNVHEDDCPTLAEYLKKHG